MVKIIKELWHGDHLQRRELLIFPNVTSIDTFTPHQVHDKTYFVSIVVSLDWLYTYIIAPRVADIHSASVVCASSSAFNKSNLSGKTTLKNVTTNEEIVF